MSYPVDYLLPNFMGSYGWLQHLRLLITKNTVSRSATRNDLPVGFALLIAFILLQHNLFFSERPLYLFVQGPNQDSVNGMQTGQSLIYPRINLSF